MICVNGREQVAWEPDMTVTRLLEIMRYSFPTIIVSVDGDLV
ncbi:MAG: sulfur carrier protein ThiS, partial [Anaerolineales bacterium]|nr:sulfur carrier protein ThiS [Anaerolineales bacterium]